MNTNELTEYIKNYIENDRTRSAIMLTGAWGCGKSYYIQNDLVPALTDKEENRCVVVSLYGIKSLEALSKSIYLEVRAKALIKKSESLNRAKIIGKTIVKGVASFFGVDISVSEENLNQLYQSIDLTGKLIILEDLERSGLSILEVMGYVNNLVEQDGVKVLLVANEGEIIQYETKKEIDGEGNKKTVKVPTKETVEYFRIKEKTISDTIPFNADFDKAIENILKSFENHYFDEALQERTSFDIPQIVYEILKIMHGIKCNNLRALLYACQKTAEMFDLADKTFSIPYFGFVLCSNIAFALRLSQNNNLLWKDDIKSPIELGTYQFPLYKCCYDYIKNQYFDRDQFAKDEENYNRQKSFDIIQKDLQEDTKTLYSFFHHSEAEVSAAVERIFQYLCKEENYFSLGQYIQLANYLIAVRGCITDESLVDRSKREIIKKLNGIEHGKDAIDEMAYASGIALWTEEQQKEFKAFQDEMVRCVQAKQLLPLGNISTSDELEKLSKFINENQNKFINKREFASKLDIEGILQTLPSCNVEVIGDLRGCLIDVYRSINIKEILARDRDSLVKFQTGLKKLISDGKIDDKIKILQLEWFVGNLEDIIEKLS